MKIRPRVKQLSGVTFTFNHQLPEIKRPKFADTLRFPDDITQLTTQNVSELLGKYTSLYSYANQELSRINAEIIRLQSRSSLRTNQVFRTNPSMNAQERWRRDAVLSTDSKMEEIERDLGRYKMQKEFTQMYVENFDKYIAALSRELSRKTHDQSLKYQRHE